MLPSGSSSLRYWHREERGEERSFDLRLADDVVELFGPVGRSVTELVVIDVFLCFVGDASGHTHSFVNE
jgi:hypothetical protein